MSRPLQIVVLGVAALIGLVLGVVLLLALGLLAVQPPGIGAAAPAQPWDIELTMTDAFMTARLNEGRSDQPISLRDAKAKFRADGTLEITGTVGASSTAAPSGRPALPLPSAVSNASVGATIVLRPTVSTDGKLTVDVVSAQLGPLTIPAGLGRLLEGPVNSQLTNAMSGQPFRLLTVMLRDGSMTVRAKQEAR